MDRSDNQLGPNVDVAAEILRLGRATPPKPIGSLPEGMCPNTLSEALELQDALHGKLLSDGHGKLVGTKIGCTTEVMQEYLGMQHPCSGGVFDTTVHHNLGEFEFDRFLHVGVECEIAAIVGKTITVSDTPYSFESILPMVESIHAAIEVVDDRYEDFENRIPDWKTWLADDFFGAGAVLGPAVHDWQSLDLAAIHGRMVINGEEVGDGYGRDIINGHPLEALAWLANEQSSLGREIPKGWIVLLGSVVQTKWLVRGDTVTVDLDGLGTATAQF